MVIFVSKKLSQQKRHYQCKFSLESAYIYLGFLYLLNFLYVKETLIEFVKETWVQWKSNKDIKEFTSTEIFKTIWLKILAT
jgi:hypothetical protein